LDNIPLSNQCTVGSFLSNESFLRSGCWNIRHMSRDRCPGIRETCETANRFESHLNFLNASSFFDSIRSEVSTRAKSDSSFAELFEEGERNLQMTVCLTIAKNESASKQVF